MFESERKKLIMTDIDKVLQTQKIKKANGLNTDKEDLLIVNEVFSMLPADEEPKEKPKVVQHPLIKCKELFPVYKEAFQNLQNTYSTWKNDSTDENYEKFCSEFYKFNDLDFDFFDAMIEFGNFIDAVPIPELPPEFMLPIEEIMNNPLDYCFDFAINLLQVAIPFVEDALATADKGKCMTLAPYMSGCCTNMLFAIKDARYK